MDTREKMTRKQPDVSGPGWVRASQLVGEVGGLAAATWWRALANGSVPSVRTRSGRYVRRDIAEVYAAGGGAYMLVRVDDGVTRYLGPRGWVDAEEEAEWFTVQGAMDRAERIGAGIRMVKE